MPQKPSPIDYNPKQALDAFKKRLREGLTQDKSLRWNQKDVLETILAFLDAKPGETVTETDRKGDEGEPLLSTKGLTNTTLIESSPGSGKTRMMGFIAKQAAGLNGSNSNHKPKNTQKVLLLTPRLGLNRQTLREFDKELEIRDADVALYDSNQRRDEKERAKDAPVLIATYHSLRAMLEQGVISLDPTSPQYRGTVLMDEVHEIVPFTCKPRGSRQKATIASFMNDHQTTLLFTGTDDGVSLKHFGGQVPTIYSKRLVKAHNQGLTCETIHPGLIDVSTSEEDTGKLIASFSKNSHRDVVNAAVDAQLEARHPSMGPLHHYKSLFFVNGVKAGREGMEYFNERARELAKEDESYINPVTGRPLEAAHIHAKTPKEERECILDDYKLGKISAIFNDEILTFGYDNRETAVIHDLKMHQRERGASALAEMEQIFTRGTRMCDKVLRENPEGANKPPIEVPWKKVYPNLPKKEALLITYRPRDEKGEPLNGVLTSADLLTGLRLAAKPPRNKKHPTGGDVDGPDHVQPGGGDDDELSNLNVTLHFDFEAQAAIAAAMQEKYEKENVKLPDKVDGVHLTLGEELPRKLGVGATNPKYIAWREDAEAKLAKGEVVSIGEYPVQKMRSGKSAAPFCLHIDAVPALAEQLGLDYSTEVLPTKIQGTHLALGNQLPKALGIGTGNPEYLAWKNNIEARLAEGEAILIGGYPVQKMRGSKNPICAHINSLPAIAEQIGLTYQDKELPTKVQGIHLTLGSELPRKLGSHSGNSKYEEWRETVEAKLAKDETVFIGEHQVQKMQAGPQAPICLHVDAVPILAKQLGFIYSAEKLPNKIQGTHLALSNELPKELGINPSNPKYLAWRESVEAKLLEGEKVCIGRHSVEKMKSITRHSVCLHIDAVPALARQLGLDYSLEALPTKIQGIHLTIARELPIELGISHVGSKYLKWRHEVEAKLANGEAVSIGGYPVQKMAGSKNPICLHIDAVPALQEELERREREMEEAPEPPTPVVGKAEVKSRKRKPGGVAD